MARRKIRVLQLIDSFAMGGAERVVLMLAKHTDPEHFDVIPCALHRSGPLEEEFKAAGLNFRVLDLQRRSILTGPLFLADLRHVLSTLAALLDTLSIDIVHTHLTHSSLMGILAARYARSTPVCATMHSVLIGTGRSRFSLRKHVMSAGINLMYSRADRVIAVSAEVEDALRTHTRIPPERVVTIPNGIDPSRFQCQEDRHTLRLRLQLPIDRPIIISVGRLIPPKGFRDLLEALTLIPPKERPLLLIVGDGPDYHKIKSQATSLKLAEDVRLLGNRHDIPALLAAADCFVLASLWEGLSLALLEAMASGLPAVATAVGGNPNAIEHGETGLLVPKADPSALAQAICHMLQDPHKRDRMGEMARKEFERRFSLTPFICAHEQLYRQILAAGRVPSTCR